MNKQLIIMNKVLLDILFGDEQNLKLWYNHRLGFRYRFLDGNVNIFEEIFYPYIERLAEKQQLQTLVERLSPIQKENLLRIPEEYLLLTTTDIINIDIEDGEENTLELKCYVRVVKSYKHQAFFELLNFISINKNYSIDKENHGFGYHFHLFEKNKRTATLLTFDREENPCKMGEPSYDTFLHSLYYEPHSEGSKAFQDINSKNKTFKSGLYTICKNIVVNKITKIDFKKQSATKSIKYVP